MRSLYRLGALAVGIAAMCVSGIARAEAPEKISLSILYEGQPESPRAKDFAQFLREHFTKVEVTDVAKFTPAQTSAYDVVIFDADAGSTNPYDTHSEFGKLAKLQLPANYSKPTVLQGLFGSRVGSSLGLRLGFS
ncbi:MAG: hypothetical protein ACLQVA_13315 [Candidatus Brocadiia bacterium]